MKMDLWGLIVKLKHITFRALNKSYNVQEKPSYPDVAGTVIVSLKGKKLIFLKFKFYGFRFLEDFVSFQLRGKKKSLDDLNIQKDNN